MMLFLIGALVTAMLAGIFMLQNAIPVTVTFLVWSFEASLAVVLLLAFVLGVVVAFLLSFSILLRRARPRDGSVS